MSPSPKRRPIVWRRAAIVGAIMFAVALGAGPLVTGALWFAPSWLQWLVGLLVGSGIYYAGKAVGRPWYRPDPGEIGAPNDAGETT